MKFVRKHKIISIVVLCSLIVFLGISAVFGRYIRNFIYNYILETKAFYFNSTVLSVNGKNYSISNWDGVNAYTLTIDINNRKNENKHTQFDISYNISYSCPSTVNCVLSKQSGVLPAESYTDTYQLTVTPITPFHENESVTVSTSVTSSSPYQKTMSANYTIGVTTSRFSYEIKDSPNSKFLKIIFTNSVSFYKVSEAFGSYAVGDLIGLYDYNNLTKDQKEKCYSAIVTVNYDPSKLFVDMTNDNYLNHLSTNYQETTIDGHQWVSQFSFKVNASSSSEIIFYKDDITQNYTYPIVNNTSIITVSTDLANQ